MKLNQKLVDQLAKGEIAVINDGSLEQLKEVLSICFIPNDRWRIEGIGMYHYRCDQDDTSFQSSLETILPKVSISKFYQMEKEIIGYKLIKPNYREAADAILEAFGLFLEDNDEITHDNPVEIMKEAGVLGKWFTPIYKEETFRVGDVVVKEWNYNEDMDIFQVSRIEFGNLYSQEYLTNWHIIDCTITEPSAPLKKDSRFNMRHATPQEKKRFLMDKANREYPKETQYRSALTGCLLTVQGSLILNNLNINDGKGYVCYRGKWAEKTENRLPIINGHKGEDRGDFIKYGCQSYLKARLIMAFNTLNLSSFNLLTEDGIKVKVSKEQVKQLKKYLK